MEALSTVDHRGLLRLAWPIMVTMLSYTMLSLVNSIYVGWLGTADLAAIGLSSTLVYLVHSFGMGLLSGVRVLVANRTGAGEPEEARAHAWLGVWAALALGLAAASLAPVGSLAFRAMGAEPEVVPLAAAYFGWRVLATPVLYLSTVLGGWFQGRGDTRTPMVANLVANVVNLVLDPLLIFGLGPFPRMGIDGAGLGCAIGVAAGALYVAWRSIGPLGRAIGPTRARWAALWRQGSPSGVHYLLDVGSYVVLTGLLTWAGEAHLAAHVIVVRIVMFSFLPCLALAEATQVLVGQTMGAGRPDLARTALRLGATQAAGIMLALAGFYTLAPSALTSVFHAAPDVTAIATPIIVLYGVVQVLDGVMVVMFGALTGAGDTRFVMRAGLTSAWLVKLPVALIAVLGLGLGAYGAWLGIGTEIAFATALGTWRVLGRRWTEVPTPATRVAAA